MSEMMQLERLQFMADLFENEPVLFDHQKIPEIQAKGSHRIVAVLPLLSHKAYGESVLSIFEKYDETGSIQEYRYAWELPDTKARHKKKQTAASYYFFR